jgi:signal recognition particle receptor subunit alpha
VKRKQKGKVLRKWGDEVPSESDMASLDFSHEKQSDIGDRPASSDLQALVAEASLGSRTKDGLYEVKDWEFANGGTADDVITKALSGNLDEESKPAQSSLGALGSLFARFTGTKVLSEDDLKPVLEGMKQHLMKKNVAKEIAEKVCEGVGQSLVGKKVGGFQSTSDAHSTAPGFTRILSYSDERGCAAGTVQFYHTHPHSEDVYGSAAFHPRKAILSPNFDPTAYTLQYHLRRC